MNDGAGAPLWDAAAEEHQRRAADARRLSDALLRLCDISSPTGEERALCDIIESDFDRIQNLAEKPRRYHNSLVVPVSRGSGGPSIALSGHFDVVPTEHDAPPRIDGDRLYGPGASDMKGGLALMLDLAARDTKMFQGLDLTLVFYSREEGPYLENELGHVLEEDPDLKHVDLAVCLEPTDNKLSLGAMGSIHAGITFGGRTAHSARPWQGENAIHKAGPFLMELLEQQPREVCIDGLIYRSVTSATLAHGGRGRNVVPDVFSVNLNHRFTPGTSLEQAQAYLESLVAGRAEIEWRDLSPSALPFASHPLVTALHGAGVTAVEPKQAWTDVARFASLGVPAVNFGPGITAQAHQRNEWASISMLVDALWILRRWLRAVGQRTSRPPI